MDTCEWLPKETRPPSLSAVLVRFAAWSSANVFVAFEILCVSLRKCCCSCALTGCVCGALSSAPRASRMRLRAVCVCERVDVFCRTRSQRPCICGSRDLSIPCRVASTVHVMCSSAVCLHAMTRPLCFARSAPQTRDSLLAQFGECGWCLRRMMTATVVFVHASTLHVSV